MFVVDSSSSDGELLTAQEELRKCLENPILVGLPLLIICNKQDLAGAQPVEQVSSYTVGTIHLSLGPQHHYHWANHFLDIDCSTGCSPYVEVTYKLVWCTNYSVLYTDILYWNQLVHYCQYVSQGVDTNIPNSYTSIYMNIT